MIERQSEQEVIAIVERLADPLISSEGMVLIDVEFRRESHGRVLRVYVDRQPADRQNSGQLVGVTLDDCTNISHQLGDLLDAKAKILVPYNLEVSSPGFSRPLTKERHFSHFLGRKALIKVTLPSGEKNSLRGTLEGFVDGVVHLRSEKGEITQIPYAQIESSRLDE